MACCLSLEVYPFSDSCHLWPTIAVCDIEDAFCTIDSMRLFQRHQKILHSIFLCKAAKKKKHTEKILGRTRQSCTFVAFVFTDNSTSLEQFSETFSSQFNLCANSDSWSDHCYDVVRSIGMVEKIPTIFMNHFCQQQWQGKKHSQRWRWQYFFYGPIMNLFKKSSCKTSLLCIYMWKTSCTNENSCTHRILCTHVFFFIHRLKNSKLIS